MVVAEECPETNSLGGHMSTKDRKAQNVRGGSQFETICGTLKLTSLGLACLAVWLHEAQYAEVRERGTRT